MTYKSWTFPEQCSQKPIFKQKLCYHPYFPFLSAFKNISSTRYALIFLSVRVKISVVDTVVLSQTSHTNWAHPHPLCVFVSLTNAVYTTIIRLYSWRYICLRLYAFCLFRHLTLPIYEMLVIPTYRIYIHFSYKIRVC